VDPIFMFWIVIAVITGAVVLLYPLAIRLGRFLDAWIDLRRTEDEGGRKLQHQLEPLLQRLETRLDDLESEQARIQEQHQFMESLLEQRDPKRIDATGDGSGER
jgi:nitrogen fixation/metabolism regulation signal transduction histidine kinase